MERRFDIIRDFETKYFDIKLYKNSNEEGLLYKYVFKSKRNGKRFTLTTDCYDIILSLAKSFNEKRKRVIITDNHSEIFCY